MKLDFNKVFLLGVLKLATVAAFANGFKGDKDFDMGQSLCVSAQQVQPQAADACFRAGEYRGKVSLAAAVYPKTEGLEKHQKLSEELKTSCSSTINVEKIKTQIASLNCKA